MSSPRDSRPTPTPAERADDVRRILTRLGRLRARIRTIFATIGLSRWVVAALGALALFFLADWLLDLPLGVRRFVRLGLLQPPEGLGLLLVIPLVLVCGFLAVAFARRGHRAAGLFSFVAAGLVGLLAWWAYRVVRPLRTDLPDGELALSVESRFRHLRDRLAAALDFQKQLEHPTRGESPAMMAAVVHEAAEEARALSFSKAVSGRRAMRWAGGAALAAAAALLVVAALPDEVGLWARRSLLLEDVAWPRETTMVAVDVQPDGSYVAHDPAQAYQVPIGRSLTVYAQAQGEAPEEALVLDMVPGQAPLARRMFGIPGKPDVFAYEFLDVRRPFSFVVQGGDDDDDTPRYEVSITIPPRVLSMRSTITYPDYLERPEETIEDGTVAVPQGSKVDVTFTTDMDIEHAEAVLGEDVLAVEPSTPGGLRAFRFRYTAEESVDGRIVLRTADGKENDPAADAFEVRVQTDQAPRIDWLWPRTSLEVTPGGRLPLLAQALDDHGVRDLRLDVRINGEEPVGHDLRPYDPDEDAGAGPVPTAVDDGPFGRRRVLTYVPVEMAALRTAAGATVAPQDSVSFRLVASDSRGQARESDWVRVDVRAPGSTEINLANQRSNVRLAFEAVLREQQARREDIKSVLADPIGTAELDLIKSVRFAQGKIAQDTDRAVQDLLAVFNGFVYDRLGAEGPTTRILAILDAHHRATYGLPADRSEEPPLRPVEERGDWAGDPVFPYVVYDRIVQAWRNKVIYDTGLLDKMCGALADAVEVGARLAPRTHRAAAEAVGGDVAQVRALLVAQDRHVAALQRLLESMEGWQNLHELKIQLSRIIDEQEVLLRQLEGDKPAKDTERK